MNKLISSLTLMLISISTILAQDVEGSKDPAMFTRMPGYHIYRYDDIQFDKYEFRISDNKTQIVEGHHLFIMYDQNNNTQAPSPLQIGRNYINAAKKIGGQLIYEYQDPGEDVVLKVVKNGMEVWAYVSANGSGTYGIHLVEKQGMNQDVLADANSMANSLRELGKIALYGIYFDTGKATLKPESTSAIQEIAKLLKADSNLKIYVVGHTDNVGAFDVNMKLSRDRADAVVNVLVTQYSVNITRLVSCGDGPTSPVASNDNEEGRAKNRRVELVKQ
jgi:OmpA-OmpF porin, OOP family